MRTKDLIMLGAGYVAGRMSKKKIDAGFIGAVSKNRIHVRRSKRNPDFWEVMDGKTSKGMHLSKRAAQSQADAIRRIRAKRK